MSKENTNMVIILSCAGEELYRLNTADFVEEISIGRSPDCTWSVGHADSSTSSRHAMISRRKSDFYLTDLGSRNGIYLNERRIKEIKLAAGMNLHLGDCLLAVVPEGAKSASRVRPHYLKYVDDQGRNIRIKLMPGTIKLGGGSRCNVVLNSSLVSTPHASITRKNDGSCWIKDLSSRNGTAVNSVELPAKTERMLKNGDVISLADIDLTYHDGSSTQNVLKMTAALLTLVVTACICLGVYYSYMQVSASSQELLSQAREAAKVCEFDRARQLVAAASSARNANHTENERKLLLARLDSWEMSARRWEELKTLLSSKNFKMVPQLIGAMDLKYITSWDWNETEAVQARTQIEYIRELFNSFTMLEMVGNTPDATLAQLNDVCGKIDSLIARAPADMPEYLANVVKFAKDLSARTNSIKSALTLYEDCLKQLDGANPAPADAIKKLETLSARVKAPIINSKSAALLPILYAVQQAQKNLDQRWVLISDMRFEECMAMDVAIPENKLQLKGLDALIADLKLRNQKAAVVAANMAMLTKSLQNQSIAPGADVPALAVLNNRADMARVFACDTLQQAPVKRTRTKGAGKYDEIVGVEYLYGVLSLIRSGDEPRTRYHIPFETVLERAARQTAQIEFLLRYMNVNRLDSASGKLAAYRNYLRSQLVLRDRIISDMQSRIAAAKAGSREYFIAHGIAYTLKKSAYFSAQRQNLGKEFAAFRGYLQDMSRKYNEALPADAIKLRDALLTIGLPGDPVIKRMWSLR